MRHSRLLLALPITLALAACQGQTVDAPETSATTDNSPRPAEPQPSTQTTAAPEQELARVRWHTDDVVPASAPVLVGDALVLYSVDDDHLMLTGVDPQDGAVLWSSHASASLRPRGQALRVKEVGGLVAHLEPSDSGPANAAVAFAVLRDPVTGHEVLRSSDALSHADLPSACPHDGAVACLTVPVNGDWSQQALMSDGRLETPPETAAGVPGWTAIGTLGLSRLAGDNTQVGRIVDGEPTWQIDTTQTYGAGQSTATGWLFDSFGDDSVLVGSIGLGLEPPADGEAWDLTEHLTLGLDATTGEVLWRAPATSNFCDTDITGNDDDPLLACLWHNGQGVAHDRALTYEDIDIDLVRLDPLTGERLWQVALGATTSADGEPSRPEPWLVSPSEIAVTSSDGLLIIDVETGADRPATASDRHWVEDSDLVDLQTPGSAVDQVLLTGRYRVLDGTGEPAPDVPWPLPGTIGIDLADSAGVVVAEPDGLTAYADPGSDR